MAGQWELSESRGSRSVLREPEGETPSGHSPSLKDDEWPEGVSPRALPVLTDLQSAIGNLDQNILLRVRLEVHVTLLCILVWRAWQLRHIGTVSFGSFARPTIWFRSIRPGPARGGGARQLPPAYSAVPAKKPVSAASACSTYVQAVCVVSVESSCRSKSPLVCRRDLVNRVVWLAGDERAGRTVNRPRRLFQHQVSHVTLAQSSSTPAAMELTRARSWMLRDMACCAAWQCRSPLRLPHGQIHPRAAFPVH
jgi:hypothetical protein